MKYLLELHCLSSPQSLSAHGDSGVKNARRTTAQVLGMAETALLGDQSLRTVFFRNGRAALPVTRCSAATARCPGVNSLIWLRRQFTYLPFEINRKGFLQRFLRDLQLQRRALTRIERKPIHER